MKKIILIAAAALLSLSASAQKFAHVNFNELVMLMPAADSARAQIAASQQEAQDTYKSMTDEFQVKYQQYQQKSSTWTPAIRESKERRNSRISRPESRISTSQSSRNSSSNSSSSWLLSSRGLSQQLRNSQRKAVTSMFSKRLQCCMLMRLRA